MEPLTLTGILVIYQTENSVLDLSPGSPASKIDVISSSLAPRESTTL